MLASEYIEELKKFIEKHGDLPVETMGFYGRTTAPSPSLKYRKILANRERRPAFAYLESERAEPVCYI
jgi:hypothetical protein